MQWVLGHWEILALLAGIIATWAARGALAKVRDRRLDDQSEEIGSITTEVNRLATGHEVLKSEMSQLRQAVERVERLVERLLFKGKGC